MMIHNRDNYELDITIQGTVLSLCVLNNGNLVSAGSSLKIWKIDQNEYELVCTLQGHKGRIYKVIEMEDGKICSCSSDKTIKIWDDYQCIKTLTDYSNYDNTFASVVEINDYLISVGDEENRGMRIWNKSTFRTIKEIEKIYCYCDGLKKLQKNAIIIGGINEIFKLDILSFQYKSLKNQGLGNIYSICVLNFVNLILLGNTNGSIICFDASLDEIISIQKLHKSDVYCIIENEEGLLFSSSADHTINVYE